MVSSHMSIISMAFQSRTILNLILTLSLFLCSIESLAICILSAKRPRVTEYVYKSYQTATKIFITTSADKFVVHLKHKLPVAVVTPAEEYPLVNHTKQTTITKCFSRWMAFNDIFGINARHLAEKYVSVEKLKLMLESWKWYVLGIGKMKT